MRIPLEWIKEFVKIDISPKKLADGLTMSGVEVSAIEYHGKNISDVVVGKIKNIEKHPSKPDVFICQVDTGEKMIQVVTKAVNLKVGDKVPVALHGAVLPGDIKVEKRELHGIESFGMLCSTVELGLSNEAEGIMILDRETALGEDIRRVIGVGGVVLEADILPNRADCLSVIGIAREVAAIFNKQIKLQSSKPKESAGNVSKEIKVIIKNEEACPRYMARAIRDIKVKDSPKWLQDRLVSCGMRPINNIVDVTNYVMLETGQPLHAFDKDRISGGAIMVRNARKGETIKTLDGEDRHLEINDLVISDDKKALAIAGVIGGESSAVSRDTKAIILESAYFDPRSVHRTEKCQKVRTESSVRFEKGVAWNGVERALDRAASLIAELSGGKVVKGKIDLASQAPKPKKIIIDIQKVNNSLGIKISTKEAIAILVRLGFSASKRGSRQLAVEVPLFRAGDVERDIDVIEEIARIYGYDRIQRTLPKVVVVSEGLDKSEGLFTDVQQLLINYGMNEVKTYSMMSEADAGKLGDEGLIRLTNAISPELGIMRTSLIPNMLKVVKHNQSHQIRDISLFEAGRVYINGEQGPVEKMSLAAVLTGQVYFDYEGKKNDPDAFYLKNIINEIMRLAGSGYELSRSKSQITHPGRSADISIKGKNIGTFGELHPDVAAYYGLKGSILFMEIDIEAIFSVKGQLARFTGIPKYPSINRDIAMLVPVNVENKAIIAAIKEAGGPLIEEIRLFDRYSGKQVKSGFSSLAYSISYRDPKRTLSDEEVNKKQEEVIGILENKLKIEVRKQ